LEFVNELYEKWKQRVGSQEKAASEPADSDPLGMEPGSIFVSYSSGDRPAVETLCDAFEEAKIDAWFDRQQLKAGDDWERKIRKNIIRCSLFMPVISQSVVSRATGRENFRDEWGLGNRAAREIHRSRSAIYCAGGDRRHAAGAGPGHPGGIHPQAGRECARWESDR
jgi:hypothetical protein